MEYLEGGEKIDWIAANGIKYSIPFARGTHQDAFKQIGDNSELRPAEGIELSYIFDGAFKAETPEWKKIGGKFVRSSYLRNPMRLYIHRRALLGCHQNEISKAVHIFKEM